MEVKGACKCMDAAPDAKLSALQFNLGFPNDWLALAHEPVVPITAPSEGADEERGSTNPMGGRLVLYDTDLSRERQSRLRRPQC